MLHMDKDRFHIYFHYQNIRYHKYNSVRFDFQDLHKLCTEMHWYTINKDKYMPRTLYYYQRKFRRIDNSVQILYSL